MAEPKKVSLSAPNNTKIIVKDGGNVGCLDEGDLVVLDKNRNGKIDKKDDVFTVGKDDKSISSLFYFDQKSQLNKLNIKTFRLEFYFETLVNAESGAKDGNLIEMEANLDSARRWANEKMDATVDMESLKWIKKIGLGKAIEAKFAETEEYAENGDLESMKRSIETIEKYATDGGIILDVNKVKELTTNGYKNAMEVKLSEAKKYADKGDIIAMKFFIDAAEKYAVEGGVVSYEEKVKEIKSRGYMQAVTAKVGKAREYAEVGDIDSMNRILGDAEKIIAECGIDREKTQIDDVKKIGYKKIAEIELNNAKANAANGDIGAMMYFIDLAKKYLEGAEIDPAQTRLKEIKDEGYTRAMENEFDDAEEWAIEGSVDLMEDYIKAAEKYAAEGEIKVDEARVGKIREKGYERAIKRGMVSIESCASSGDIKSLKEHIEELERYASKIGYELNREKINEIKMQGYAVAIGQEIWSAKYDENEGSLEEMKAHIETAKQYKAESGTDYYQDEIKELEDIMNEKLKKTKKD